MERVTGKALIVALIVVIAAIGGGRWYLKVRHIGTDADFALLFDRAEELAVMSAPLDATAVSSVLKAQFAPLVETPPVSLCEDRALNPSRVWRSSPQDAGWALWKSFGWSQPHFLLRIGAEPAACRGEDAGSILEARFIEIYRWRCLTGAVLKPRVADFQTNYQDPHGALILSKRTVREDGLKARVEIVFRSGTHYPCLYSVAVKISKS